MPVQCTCAHCGAVYRRPPSRAAINKYCSRACRRANRSVEVVCATCGTPFTRYRAMVVSALAFCSKRCKGAAMRYSPEQFWALVRKGDDCWDWQGRQSSDGYGVFALDHQRWRAHRLAWTLAHGPIPSGLFVCHHCDRPLCVRPEHLFLGTNDDNMRDMHEKGRGVLPPSVLSEREVVEIRRLYAQFEAGYGRLARRFGVHVSTIAMVVNRKTWRHLKE